MKEQKGTFLKQESIPNNALLSSYKVAYRVAKCNKPRYIVEEIILPAVVDMVNIVFSESAGRQPAKLPLSNNTVSHRIQRVAEDLKNQLFTKLKEKVFG